MVDREQPQGRGARIPPRQWEEAHKVAVVAELLGLGSGTLGIELEGGSSRREWIAPANQCLSSVPFRHRDPVFGIERNRIEPERSPSRRNLSRAEPGKRGRAGYQERGTQCRAFEQGTPVESTLQDRFEGRIVARIDRLLETLQPTCPPAGLKSPPQRQEHQRTGWAVDPGLGRRSYYPSGDDTRATALRLVYQYQLHSLGW